MLRVLCAIVVHSFLCNYVRLSPFRSSLPSSISALLTSFIVELFVITDLILSSYDLLLIHTSSNAAFVSGQFVIRCICSHVTELFLFRSSNSLFLTL